MHILKSADVNDKSMLCSGMEFSSVHKGNMILGCPNLQ